MIELINSEYKTRITFRNEWTEYFYNLKENFIKELLLDYKEFVKNKMLKNNDFSNDLFITGVEILFEEEEKKGSKNSFDDYKKSLWEKGQKMDFQSLMMWYEKYLKLEYEKEKYNNFIKELQG